MADAGKAMMLYKGVYDSTIEYEILDVVNYNGSLYISKINNNLDYEPTLDETKWQLFLEGGTSKNIQVTDTQGIVGDAGSSSFVQTLLDGIAEKVVNIISGSEVVKKATQDGNGNNIVNTYVNKSKILDTTELISANTASENVAGALALKEVISDVNTKMTLSGKPFSGNLTPNEIFEKVKNVTNTYFSWVNYNDTAYNPLGTTGNWQYEILNVYTNNVSYLYLKATRINTGEQWIYTKNAGWTKTSLGNKKYGTLTVVNANGKEYSYVRSIGGEFGVLEITCLIPAIEAWGESIIYTSDIKPTNEIVFMVVDQDTRETVRCLFNTSGQVIAQAKGKAYAGGWVGGSCTFM